MKSLSEYIMEAGSTDFLGTFQKIADGISKVSEMYPAGWECQTSNSDLMRDLSMLKKTLGAKKIPNKNVMEQDFYLMIIKDGKNVSKAYIFNHFGGSCWIERGEKTRVDVIGVSGANVILKQHSFGSKPEPLNKLWPGEKMECYSINFDHDSFDKMVRMVEAHI